MLVVEDDDDLRTLFIEGLEQLGYRTAGARNGAQGLEAALRLVPDAVLMDVSMPGAISGIEATRLLRADPRTRDCFVIVITGRGMSMLDEAESAGCDAFFCKPFTTSALEIALRPLRAGAPELPATETLPGAVKRCSCGRDLTRKEWLALPICGHMRGPRGATTLELRTCTCGSTLALVLDGEHEGLVGEPSELVTVDRALVAERRTLFIVDRDPHVRRLVRQFLRDGYDFEFFDDGAAALDAVRASMPYALITEILVPKLDGLSLCLLLKADPTTKHLPILVFSMLSAAERARESGADAFLEKPLERSSLLASLAALTDVCGKAA